MGKYFFPFHHNNRQSVSLSREKWGGGGLFPALERYFMAGLSLFHHSLESEHRILSSTIWAIFMPVNKGSASFIDEFKYLSIGLLPLSIGVGHGAVFSGKSLIEQ